MSYVTRFVQVSETRPFCFLEKRKTPGVGNPGGLDSFSDRRAGYFSRPGPRPLSTRSSRPYPWRPRPSCRTRSARSCCPSCWASWPCGRSGSWPWRPSFPSCTRSESERSRTRSPRTRERREWRRRRWWFSSLLVSPFSSSFGSRTLAIKHRAAKETRPKPLPEPREDASGRLAPLAVSRLGYAEIRNGAERY